MASRLARTRLAHPRRGGPARSATRVDYRSLILVLGFLSLAAFAGVLYLSQASVATELRFALGSAEEQTEDLYERNLALRQEIARASSLAGVEARAQRLGMVSAPLTGPYVACVVPNGDVPPARQPGLASAPGASPSADEGPWMGLLRLLGLARSPAPGEHVVFNIGQ